MAVSGRGGGAGWLCLVVLGVRVRCGGGVFGPGGRVVWGVFGRVVGAICGDAGRGVLFSESLLLKQRKQRPNPFKIRQDLVRFTRPWGGCGGRDSDLNPPGTAICKGRGDRVSLKSCSGAIGGPVRVVLVPGAVCCLRTQ